MFTNEVSKNESKILQRKVNDLLKESDRFLHGVVKYVVGLINETNYRIAGMSKKNFL